MVESGGWLVFFVFGVEREIENGFCVERGGGGMVGSRGSVKIKSG